MDSTIADPLVGRVVDGRYAVTSKIARGGMATVYLATDTRLEREVALKVMHPHLADDDQFVARFHREAKSAARLSHPNVVAVFDQGEDGGAVYLAMEMVDGRTLRDHLTRHGPLSPGQALEVLDAVLDALAAAHRAGIVHRDVKPENVLVTDDGRIKVADFGLARAATTSTSGATTGMLMGTVAYLSPELVTRGVADARSDVYAAGILLYEVLTGRQPITGDVPIQVAYQHVNSGVPAPSGVDPGLPRELDDLVLWATARDPDERPADAGALLGEVRALRRGLPESVLDRDPDPQDVPAVGAGDDVPGAGATIAIPRERRALALPVDEEDDGGVDGGVAPGDWGYGPGGHRRRRGLVALVAVLLTALLAGVTAWFFTAGPGAYTTTPDVVGQPVAQAEQVLRTSGLEPEQVPQYHEEIPAGTVIQTRPGPGGDVRKGGGVELVVSQGSAFTAMPDLVGSTREDAVAVLEENDLAVGEVTEDWSEDVPQGSVVAQSVPAGETVRRTLEIDLQVSRGREPIDVPTVTGQPRADAERAVTDAGLTTTVREEFSETVERGTVISQDPEGGTLFRGDPVELVVSAGPPLVEIPQVRGKQSEEATRILEAEGFVVEVQRLVTGGFDTVLGSSPGAGEQAPKGSTVVLRVV
ncbi:Stk1 family PASTA domain-containing Ser/Thr kinase [Thalassiella azotivora]